MPEEIVEEVEVKETVVLPPPTIEELHTFLLALRASAYVSALQTAKLIDAWLVKYPLPAPPPEDEPQSAEEPQAAAA